MKVLKQSVSALGFLLISPTVFAIDAVRLVGAVTGGMAISSDAGAAENFSIGASKLDYDPDHNTEVRGVYGGLLGAEIPLYSAWTWQTGVAYYQTSPFAADGTFSQGFNPQTSAQYDYNYKIVSRQLLWENKFLLQWCCRYRPYVSVGLGVAFNTAKDFNIYYDPTQDILPLYENHTETSFTYNVGVGLDYDITEHFRLGLGYRFTDLGKAKLGKGAYDPIDHTPISNTLEQSNLYTQEVILQLTYLM